MEYRPEGLVNPYADETRYGKPYGRAKDWEETVDSVIQLLRMDGDRELIGVIGAPFGYKEGTWVFIPDVEAP